MAVDADYLRTSTRELCLSASQRNWISTRLPAIEFLLHQILPHFNSTAVPCKATFITPPVETYWAVSGSPSGPLETESTVMKLAFSQLASCLLFHLRKRIPFHPRLRRPFRLHFTVTLTPAGHDFTDVWMKVRENKSQRQRPQQEPIFRAGKLIDNLICLRTGMVLASYCQGQSVSSG